MLAKRLSIEDKVSLVSRRRPSDSALLAEKEESPRAVARMREFLEMARILSQQVPSLFLLVIEKTGVISTWKIWPIFLRPLIPE
jgi:hypothetical protein